MRGFYFILLGLILLLSSSLSAQSLTSVSYASFEEDAIISIGWYPNPVKVGDRVSIVVELKYETEMRTEVLDALGRKVFEITASYPKGQSKQFIFTEDLEAGLYFIRITTDREAKTEKIILE
ncbi:MAG: T9SS type A sorting domain-containing protein [Bacteroidota bacterium]